MDNLKIPTDKEVQTATKKWGEYYSKLVRDERLAALEDSDGLPPVVPAPSISMSEALDSDDPKENLIPKIPGNTPKYVPTVEKHPLDRNLEERIADMRARGVPEHLIAAEIRLSEAYERDMEVERNENRPKIEIPIPVITNPTRVPMAAIVPDMGTIVPKKRHRSKDHFDWKEYRKTHPDKRKRNRTEYMQKYRASKKETSDEV
jgi:hypothetical protein